MTQQHTCANCNRSKDQVSGMIQMASHAMVCSDCVKDMHEIFQERDDRAAWVKTGSKTPRDIVSFLNDYVIGQDAAKVTLAVAIYNHYKRLNHQGDVELAKSNILMLGPTGTGKTLLAQTIARLLDVPFAIADATSLTQAGYVGDDVETVVARLVQSADGDIEKAERGIIFVDEIDKIAAAKAGPSITRDVSGEGVQQALLKLIEGSLVNVPEAGGRKHPGAHMNQVNTRNILFICAGAFVPLLEKLNKKEAEKNIGFVTPVASVTDEPKEVTPEMLFEAGMIQEFVGRLPVITTLEALDQAALERILVEPKNAITRQMEVLFKLDGAQLVFEDGAIPAIARQALERKTGARGARGILEKLLEKAQFEVPGSSDAIVTVTRDLSVRIDYPQALAA
jgi:ATP-dependent Clp protease ATP-binding subunit ClpX